MDDPDPGREGDVLLVPPVPLASGMRLPDGRRIARVDLVVTTEDGERTTIALREQHGAWWAPSR